MKKSRFGSVYMIRNLLNGKVYIGLTRHYVSDRWYQHKKAASIGASSALYQAMRKYGAENFSIEQLASAISHASLGDLERELIKQYGSLGGAGYNMSLGGEAAIERRLTPEGKARLSAARNRPDRLAAMSRMNIARMSTDLGIAHQARMVEAAKKAVAKLSESRKRYAATSDGRAQILRAAKMGASKKAEVSSKAVVAAGVTYKSVTDAATVYQIERGAVRYRIKSPHFADWAWL